MTGYRLTDEASEDLIALYIQGYDLFGQTQADRYHDEMTALFERLADFPELGRLDNDYVPPVRILPHRSHVVVYEDAGGGVTILRVRYGREDWYDNPIGPPQ